MTSQATAYARRDGGYYLCDTVSDLREVKKHTVTSANVLLRNTSLWRQIYSLRAKNIN